MSVNQGFKSFSWTEPTKSHDDVSWKLFQLKTFPLYGKKSKKCNLVRSLVGYRFFSSAAGKKDMFYLKDISKSKLRQLFITFKRDRLQPLVHKDLIIMEHFIFLDKKFKNEKVIGKFQANSIRTILFPNLDECPWIPRLIVTLIYKACYMNRLIFMRIIKGGSQV